MLQTNLATRPFYNERAVQVVLGVAGGLVLLLTLFTAVQYTRLSSSQALLGATATEAEEEARRLRTEAARFRTQIDPTELEVVSRAAREANGLIDRRAFSWTALFGLLEGALPADVRLKSVQPRVEKDVFIVALVVEARSVTDLAEFIEGLEQTGAFRNVRPVEEARREGGLLDAVVESAYLPPARPSPEAPSGD